MEGFGHELTRKGRSYTAESTNVVTLLCTCSFSADSD